MTYSHDQNSAHRTSTFFYYWLFSITLLITSCSAKDGELSDDQDGDSDRFVEDMRTNTNFSELSDGGESMRLDLDADVSKGGQDAQDLSMTDMGVEMIDQQDQIVKSFKRGIAYGFDHLADFEALSEGVSWWYNWSPSYRSPVADHYQDLEVEWVPMTWNGNNPDQIRTFLETHPNIRYLLTYNEPNFQDQANLTPAYAASIWPQFEEIAEEYDVKLVGPAVNYCGGCVVVDGAPIGSPFTIWMDMFFDEFRTQFGREPRMDYTALHWYDYGLEDQVNEMVMRYGKPVWLTEFALWRAEDWATDEVERQWLLDMVAFLEDHPFVHRYAWFTGRRSDFPKINLLSEEGTLTPLGEAYVNAPHSLE